jgi:uncharacterized protein (DUF1800 family)
MSLTPYTGTWGPTQAAHLLRRTTFGANKTTINTLVSMGMNAAVSLILTPQSAPSPPLNDYQAWSPDPKVPFGQTWVNEGDVEFAYARHMSFRAWWIGQMLNTNTNITEKLTLFWHNHIPIIMWGVVMKPIACYDYLAILRHHAIGNFKDMMRDITVNPAMLVFLDGTWNNKWSPNENYARELQELFTIGKDSTPSFQEQDVRAATRILTGWHVNLGETTLVPRESPYFDLNAHDTDDKVFSSFYNNTVISGRANAHAGMDELNDLLTMIFAKEEVALYIVRRLYRYFVYYKIDASVENTIITPLANTFRANNYQLQPVLQELFLSQHFYDTQIIGALIKHPLDFIVGMAKSFNLIVTTDLVDQYGAWHSFYDKAFDMQMGLGEPPNVAGWAPYYLSPNYLRGWISPETLRQRKDFVTGFIRYGHNGRRVFVDTLAHTAAMDNPSNPNALIDEALSLAHTIPTDASIKAQLLNILLSGSTTTYYWTTAWNNYINNPTDAVAKDVVKSRLLTFYEAIYNMAEYHLG